MPQQPSDTPDLGGRDPVPGRAHLAGGRPAAGRRLLVGALSLVLAAPFLLLTYRAWYSAFPWDRSPDRIHWCGRDFDRAGPALTRAQVDAEQVSLPGDPPYPTTVVGRWPAPGWFGTGRPLLAHLTPKARQAELGVPCTMGLDLQVGPDAYAEYTLVGGP